MGTPDASIAPAVAINTRPGDRLVTDANQLGPLADLVGTWVGNGFNLISLPDFDKHPPSTGPKEFRLKLNNTRELLEFVPIGGTVPNRGAFAVPGGPAGQDDIGINGLDYLQRVWDSVTNQAMHNEPGQWLNVEGSKVNPVQPKNTLVRLGSIPHGNALLAQSTFFTPHPISGGPDIQPVDSTPVKKGGGALPLGYLDPFLNPQLPPGIPSPWVKNPNQALLDEIARQEAEGQKIVETIVIVISTVPDGSVLNIPFLVKNANVAQLDAIFWIETVKQPDGSKFLQLQYTQTVILDFLGVLWPHISVATLIKQ